MVAEVNVGTARVNFRADSTRLTRATRNANNSLRRHRASLRQTQTTYRRTAQQAGLLVGRLRGIGAALGIGLLGGGLFAGVRQLSQLGSSLVETSRAADLSVESLQNLRFVAESDGVAADQLDRALLRLNRTLGDAATGNKAAVDAFAELGLEFESLVNLRGEERFLAIARAISELEDRTLQTSAATAIFGRAGQDLLPILIQNEEALRGTIARSEELGNVTDEHAQNLKALEQTYADLEKVAVAALANIVGGFIEAAMNIDALDKEFEELFRRLGEASGGAAAEVDSFVERFTGIDLGLSLIHI